MIPPPPDVQVLLDMHRESLVERPFALSILRQGAPALLDWLTDNTAVEFPVVVANGFRVWTGSVGL